MSTQHTPGPWTVDRSVNGELEPFDSKDRHLLNSHSELPLAEREANARLIAAAPDLLDALQRIANTQYRMNKAGKVDPIEVDHCINIAKTAIKKFTHE